MQYGILRKMQCKLGFRGKNKWLQEVLEYLEQEQI